MREREFDLSRSNIVKDTPGARIFLKQPDLDRQRQVRRLQVTQVCVTPCVDKHDSARSESDSAFSCCARASIVWDPPTHSPVRAHTRAGAQPRTRAAQLQEHRAEPRRAAGIGAFSLFFFAFHGTGVCSAPLWGGMAREGGGARGRGSARGRPRGRRQDSVGQLAQAWLAQAWLPPRRRAR